MKKYIIMLSKPKKPGVAALYNGSEEIHRSAPQETFLIPSENNSLVVPPFNAYAPSGSVRVSAYYYRSTIVVFIFPVFGLLFSLRLPFTLEVTKGKTILLRACKGTREE